MRRITHIFIAILILAVIVSSGITWFIVSSNTKSEFSREEYLMVMARGSLVPVYRDLDDLLQSLYNNDSKLFAEALDNLKKDLIYLKYYGDYLSSIGVENNLSNVVKLMNKLVDRFKELGFEKIYSLYLNNDVFYTNLMTLYNAFKNRAYTVSTTGIDRFSDLVYIRAINNILRTLPS